MNDLVNKIKSTLLSFLLLASLCGFLDFSAFTTPKGDLNLIQKVRRACYLIQNYYYDPARIKPQEMMEEGLYTLSKNIPEVLVEFPKDKKNIIRVSVGSTTSEIHYSQPQKLFDIFDPIAQVIGVVRKNYKGDVTADDQEYNIINGMVAKLDPHSDLLTPKMFEEFKTQTEGEYGGLGIVVGMKDEELTVISPIEDTPAMRAGVQTDDKIIQIDDLSTTNMPLSDAVDHMRGIVGTKVTLHLERKNHEPIEITLTREQISIKSVKSKRVEADKKHIGVLRILSFQEDTYNDFKKEIAKITAAGPLDGIVLDLRNNPGGLLDQSIKVADAFLTSGDIVYTEGPNAAEQEINKASITSNEISVPLAVLINEGSASASEIVSGALQGNNRAVVLGTRSFGKGSVQSLFPLKDGSSLKLTIAQYLTPNRVSIQAVGITPDIQLIKSHVETNEFNLKEDEDVMGEKDLEEHLENKELTKITKPSFSLNYLDTTPKKPNDGDSQYTSQIDETKDYPLSLAIKVVTNTSNTNRQETLKAEASLLQNEAQTQDSKITEALKQVAVDWTQTNNVSTSAPALTFKSTFSNNSMSVDQLTAGDSITWTIFATNNGSTDITRLIGVVKSENPFLSEREFPFGNVKKGMTVSQSITIKVPKEILNFDEQTKIAFYSDFGSPPPLTVPLHIAEKPRPQLSYQYQIIDDGNNGSMGNGDGRVQKGETIVLDVTVTNKGNTSAEEIEANLKNSGGEGIFLKQGRSLIGTIEPHAQKKTSLSFVLSPTYIKEKATLKIVLLDKSTRSGLEDSVTFPLAPEKQAQIDPQPMTFQTPPTITISKKEFLKEGSELLLTGTVSDDVGIKNLIAYTGKRKVFFKATPIAENTNQNILPFTITIPLEDGANYIIINAQDNRKMTSTNLLSVVGPKPKQALIK